MTKGKGPSVSDHTKDRSLAVQELIASILKYYNI